MSEYPMALPLTHIFEKMNGIARMPAKLQLLLLQGIEHIELPKNQVLLKPGQICDHYYYIEDGILSCHPQDGDKAYCSWLMFPGDIATAVESFNNQVPSKETIRTVTPCKLHLLAWKHVQNFTDKHRAFAKIRQVLSDSYALLAWEIGVQRQHHPEEFYQYLKKLYAEHFHLIPRDLLAAYMGISPAKLYEIIKNSKR
jgi:hypothetical protein